MSVGTEVTKGTVDTRAGEAALALRQALEKVERLKLWLDDHPGYDAQSHLVTLGYSEDEAYLLHDTFSQLDTIRTTSSAALALSRKFTGLD
jgi:hypothetical protein